MNELSIPRGCRVQSCEMKKDSHSEQSKVFMDKDIFTVKSLILAQDER